MWLYFQISPCVSVSFFYSNDKRALNIHAQQVFKICCAWIIWQILAEQFLDKKYSGHDCGNGYLYQTMHSTVPLICSTGWDWVKVCLQYRYYRLSVSYQCYKHISKWIMVNQSRPENNSSVNSTQDESNFYTNLMIFFVDQETSQVC